MSSFDWFSEKQMKVLRYIRHFLVLNRTDNEPEIIDQTRAMFQACMNTGKQSCSFSLLKRMNNSFVEISIQFVLSKTVHSEKRIR